MSRPGLQRRQTHPATHSRSYHAPCQACRVRLYSGCHWSGAPLRPCLLCRPVPPAHQQRRTQRRPAIASLSPAPRGSVARRARLSSTWCWPALSYQRPRWRRWKSSCRSDGPSALQESATHPHTRLAGTAATCSKGSPPGFGFRLRRGRQSPALWLRLLVSA